MSPTLRVPAAADYTAIASWIGDATACSRWAGARLRYPFTADELPRLLHVSDGASYVLSDGSNATLGFGQYRIIEAGAAHLCRIIVAPAARGRGLGTQLCRLLLDAARRTADVQAATLRVYRDNAAAIALYRSLGFAPVEDASSADVLYLRAIVPRQL